MLIRKHQDLTPCHKLGSLQDVAETVNNYNYNPNDLGRDGPHWEQICLQLVKNSAHNYYRFKKWREHGISSIKRFNHPYTTSLALYP